MDSQNFAEKRPWIFSFLILLLLLLVQSAGVAAAQIMGLPARSLAVYSEIALVVLLVIIVSALRWWRKIGYAPADGQTLLVFLPALALLVDNLTFGIYESHLPALLMFAVLGLASGFVEETVFRGLMLRAFLPRGAWLAVLAPSILFSLSHAANLLAGADPLVTVVQVLYALAIGFGFGAMALKTGRIWPLVIAHGLGNFVAFINTPPNAELQGGLLAHFLILTISYIVIFTGYGWYLMRQVAQPGPGSEPV
jgi:uncharacterized protein